MKCEICHENTAETAIGTDGDGEELYVCKACAEKEQTRRRKRRERTRKAQEAAAKGEQPPDGAVPIIGAFISAVSDMVDGIEKAVKQRADAINAADDRIFTPLEGVKVAAPYMLRGCLHLEGLHLLGETDAIYRAVEALGLQLRGISNDGICDIGHIYTLCHCDNEERAKRVLKVLVEQERNARIRLLKEIPRVFSDSLCRALAILKNCRLLSEGEYFDLLSPLRLAAMENMLDGIKIREIERIMKSLKLEPDDPFAPPPTLEEREAADAERADSVNQRFEDVVLNEE